MSELDHPPNIQPQSATVQAIVSQRTAYPPGYPHFPSVWTGIFEAERKEPQLPSHSPSISIHQPGAAKKSTRRQADKLLSDSDIDFLRRKWESEWQDNSRPMPPPPPRIFADKDTSIRFARSWAREHNYSLNLAHTRKDARGGVDAVILVCSLADKYNGRPQTAPEVRKRNRPSRKTNCPFKLRLSKRKGKTDWLLSEGHSMHNHADQEAAAPLAPAEYPELEARLWAWQQEQPDNVHAARVKAQASTLFADMYPDQTVPDFDRTFMDGYRTRHGIKFKAVPRPVPERIDTPNTSTTSALTTPAAPADLPEKSGCQARETIALNNVLPSDRPDSLLTAVRDAVRAHMRHYDASHDWDHILRVLSLSKALVRGEQNPAIDERTVWLAALVHDLNDRKYLAPGEDASSVIFNLLTPHGCDSALAEKVQTIAAHVSYSHEIKNPAAVAAMVARYPELGIVQDADRLDAIGAIGISRTFVFTGAKRPGAGMEESIIHFTEKLELLEGMMKTATGKRMASERTRRLREFRGWWEEEYALVA